MSLLYFFIFVLSTPSVQAAGVTTGDLLYGQLGSNPNSALLTDNDVTTSYYFPLQTRITYVLDDEYTINAYRLAVNSSGLHYFYIYFYDVDGKLLANLSSTHNRDVKYQIQNTPNYYKVKSVTVINDSWSDVPVGSFELYGVLDLLAPTNLKAVSDTKKVHLTWSHLGPVEKYAVYKDGELVATTSSKGYSVFNLVPDQQHVFTVKAIFKDAYSDPSNAITSFAYDDPLAKNVLTGVVYPNEIILTWDSVPATTYKLFSNNALIFDGESKTFVHKNLKLDTDYAYYVVSIDKYGREVSSNVLALKTREPPSPVKPILKIDKNTHDQVSVSWTKLKAPYQVLLNGQMLTATNQHVYTLSDLEPETTYNIEVAYIDDYERLVKSDVLRISTLALPPSVNPILSVSNVTFKSARLTWSMSGGSYEIYLNDVKIRDQTAILYTLESLSPETQYTIKVIAIDAFNRRNESNVVIITTLAEPPPKPSPTPMPKPPPISNSGNPALNEVNDHLIQGAKDTKDSGMSMIAIIILIIILVFGIMWLLKIWKKKMGKAVGKTSSGSTAVKKIEPKNTTPGLKRFVVKPQSNYNYQRSEKSNTNYNFERKRLNVKTFGGKSSKNYRRN